MANERRDSAAGGRGSSQPGVGGSKDSDEILNVRETATAERSRAAAWIDGLGKLLARPLFFGGLLLVHLGWIAANLPFAPWEPWDPYPFVFLATVASVEAPFLSLLILIHHRRETRINELRDEVDLQVVLQMERETTAILRMVEDLHRKLEVESRVAPERVRQLEADLNARHLMESVKSHLEAVEGEGADKP
jgi:uncharacterized membrane protein